jgi:hypothetical protein
VNEPIIATMGIKKGHAKCISSIQPPGDVLELIRLERFVNCFSLGAFPKTWHAPSRPASPAKTQRPFGG